MSKNDNNEEKPIIPSQDNPYRSPKNQKEDNPYRSPKIPEKEDYTIQNPSYNHKTDMTFGCLFWLILIIIITVVLS